MGSDNEPPRKRARIDSSRHRSSEAGTASDHAAGSSAAPACRPQQAVVGTMNALWVSMRQQPAESIEAFFSWGDSGRRPASSPTSGARAPSYPASHGGLTHLLDDNRAAYSMNDNEIGASSESQTGSNPAGEFLAAFSVSDDELARIGPATNPELGVSEMPGPSGGHTPYVDSVRSPGSDAGETTTVEDDLEFDERWDSYSSDSLSESEDEAGGAMDQAPIETMDMAELGRRPRTPPKPALTYHEMIKEAEWLESSITQKELDEFFKGNFKKAFIRRRPLALIRALDLHGVHKLSDLKGAPKLPGSRRVNLQALASDIDAAKDYLMRVYCAVRYHHSRNHEAPAWMYCIAERFSLCEGRKLQRLLNARRLSNAGATTLARVSPFDEILKEAKRLEPSITRQELLDSFGGKISGESIPRTLLALERTLALHGVSKLGDLDGAPKLPGNRMINGKALAMKLGLKPRYFIGVRDWIFRYYKRGKSTPDWMYRVMDKFSLNEGRKPLPGIGIVNPNLNIHDRSCSHSSVRTPGLPGQPNADETEPEGETLYSNMIKESKLLRPSITHSEIKKFFGDLGKNNDRIRRNILAFLDVLARHKISELKDVPGAPKAPGGNISSAKVSGHLGLKKDYLQWVRASVRKYESKSKDKRAPKWMSDVLQRLSLGDGLREARHGTREEQGGDTDKSAFAQPAILTDPGLLPEASGLPGPSGG